MKALRIDLGPSANRPRRRAAWLLVAAGLAANAWLLAQGHPLWQQLARLRDEQRVAAARHAAAQEPRAEAGASPLEHAAAQADARLRTPWGDLFAGIESAADPQVVLLSLEPDAPARSVRIQAQAQDLPALLAYVSRLGELPALASVLLEAHQTQAQHPRRPVDGVIVARWRASP